MNTKYLITVMVLCFSFSDSYAAWEGPVEVVKGEWGSGDREFAMGGGETSYVFPWVKAVSNSGDVAIVDAFNDRVAIYRGNGTVFMLDGAGGWTHDVIFVGENIVALVNVLNPNKEMIDSSRKELRFYSGDGSLMVTPEQPDNIYIIRKVGGYLYAASKDLWYSYDFNGNVLTKQTEQPDKIGFAKKKRVASDGVGYARVMVEYPDQTWTLVTRRSLYGLWDYYPDNQGFLYSKAGGVRFNACGKEMGRVQVENKYSVIERDNPYLDPEVKLIVDYSSPVVGPGGSYYMGRSTPEGFAVVKWAWVDSPNDPNAGPMPPTKFIATPTNDGTKMKWRPSLDDPGCVSGYAIERALLAEGPYTVVHTTDKGVRTYVDPNVEPDTTYYYRLQALSVVEGSEYTPVISVTYLP